MGRRALRKIDPSLDLSRWLLAETGLPDPFSPDAVFGASRPLEIEVGSGKGLFMDHATGQYPDRNFLGIEISRKYARYAAARLARHQRDNGRMVHGDGLRIFTERLPAECAGAVHVYFPDPWWKARHRKRRVMNALFLRHVQRVLVPGGVLHFWTDVQEYYESTLTLIAASTDLAGPVVPDELPAEHDLDYRTHFERRMRLHELPVYRAQYQKAKQR